MTEEDRLSAGEVKRSLERIEKALDDLKKVTEPRLQSLEVSDAAHRTDLDWLKRGFWLLLGIALSALVEGTFLVIRFKMDGG